MRKMVYTCPTKHTLPLRAAQPAGLMRGLSSFLNRQQCPVAPCASRPFHSIAPQSVRVAPVASQTSTLTRNPPTLDARFKDKPNFVFTGQATPQESEYVRDEGMEKLVEYGGNLVPPGISKADHEFKEIGLEFVLGGDQVSIPELNNLFEKVGFPRRDPPRLKIALDNTYLIIWVRATKNTRFANKGEMVAFARAASDGFLSATIWDVSVHPAWQRNGLGQALMERLTRCLVIDGVPTITLYAEPKVIELYEKVGFTKDPEGIRGMAFQRRKRHALQQLGLPKD